MFSREQILITNQFVSTLKAWEKAVVRNYGTHDTPYHQLLLFSRDWFEAKDHHRIKCPALAEGAEIKMLSFKWEIVDAEPTADDED